MIQDLEKKTPFVDNSKVELIVYDPKEKKFKWESKHKNNAVEEIVLKHLSKKEALLKRFRTIKRV